MDKDEMKWHTEDDLRTLVAAEEIKADSARLKKAMALRKKKMAAIKAVGGDK